MKRASVTVRLDLGNGSIVAADVQGYACRIAGFDMVVHRAVRHGKPPHSSGWTVTEPRTGLAVAHAYGRRLAIEASEEEIIRQGGGKAVEEAVAQAALAEETP